MIIPNIWENKKCSKPPTSGNANLRRKACFTALAGFPSNASAPATASSSPEIRNTSVASMYPRWSAEMQKWMGKLCLPQHEKWNPIKRQCHNKSAKRDFEVQVSKGIPMSHAVSATCPFHVFSASRQTDLITYHPPKSGCFTGFSPTQGKNPTCKVVIQPINSGDDFFHAGCSFW